MAEDLEGLEEVEFEGDSDLLIASRDFDRIADARINAGYLEGIEAGKQQGLNEGFRHGFRQGIECSVHWSVLRGKISALQAHCLNLVKKQDPSSSSIHHVYSQLGELMEVVIDKEKKWKEISLVDQSKAYQQSGLAKGEAQGTAASGGSTDNATLKELVSAKQANPEVQELQRRLEELRSEMNSVRR